MRTSKASGTEAATGCLTVGCVFVFQVAWVAVIVAVAVLAIRWALTTHAFGL